MKVKTCCKAITVEGEAADEANVGKVTYLYQTCEKKDRYQDTCNFSQIVVVSGVLRGEVLSDEKFSVKTDQSVLKLNRCKN